MNFDEIVSEVDQSGIFAGSDVANAAFEGFASGGAVGAAAAAAMEFVTNLIESLGAGRKEADQIVPFQNRVGNFLGLVNRAAEDPNSTVSQLRGLRAQLIKVGEEFKRFTYDAGFTDGRASHQARNTIFPLLDGTDGEGHTVTLDIWSQPVDGGTLRTVDRAIVARGGSVSDPVVNAQAGITSAASGSGNFGALIAVVSLGILLFKR